MAEDLEGGDGKYMGNSRASKNIIYARMKKWRYVSDSKLKGAYGETDYNKKVIRINKKIHKGDVKGDDLSKKDSTLINTIVHETIHKDHPKMLEKNVRKMAHKKVCGMGKKQKNKLYSKVS